MSALWVPPRPTHHLRVFVISFGLIIVCIFVLLFGVHLEDRAPATGTISARDLHQVRARIAGLVEPGWYEGEVSLPNGKSLPVRMDADGNGLTLATASSPSRPIQRHMLVVDERQLPVRDRCFHRLQPGDVAWPGQVVAVIRDEHLYLQRRQLEDQIQYLMEQGDPCEALCQERDRLLEYLALGVLRVPETAECWLVLDVPVAPLEKVNAGQVLGQIVPADPLTRQPCHLIARLEVDEKHWGEVAAGQKVRVHSNVFNSRLHGHAEAHIERLAPSADGERRFHAQAPITQAPYQLPLGSTFQADIVIGRKLVYRIILEN